MNLHTDILKLLDQSYKGNLTVRALLEFGHKNDWLAPSDLNKHVHSYSRHSAMAKVGCILLNIFHPPFICSATRLFTLTDFLSALFTTQQTIEVICSLLSSKSPCPQHLYILLLHPLFGHFSPYHETHFIQSQRPAPSWNNPKNHTFPLSPKKQRPLPVIQIQAHFCSLTLTYKFKPNFLLTALKPLIPPWFTWTKSVLYPTEKWRVKQSKHWPPLVTQDQFQFLPIDTEKAFDLLNLETPCRHYFQDSHS